MDDRRFDMLAKQLGTRNRRDVLKTMLGLGGAAVAASVAIDNAEAARRGYSGPFGLSEPQPNYEICIDGCCVLCGDARPDYVRDRLDYCLHNIPSKGCQGCAGWAGQCWCPPSRCP